MIDPLCDENIKIDTIDGFQGQESEIVIFGCTRGYRKTMFFQDWKRINVALSRVKNELIIVGRLSYFSNFDKESSCLPKLKEYIVERERAQIITFNEAPYVPFQPT